MFLVGYVCQLVIPLVGYVCQLNMVECVCQLNRWRLSLEGDGGLAGDDASLPHLSPNPHPNPMNSPRQGMRGLGFSRRKKEV